MINIIPNVEYYATIELKKVFNGVRKSYNCLNIIINIKGILDDIINDLIPHIEEVGYIDNHIEISTHTNYIPHKTVAKKLIHYNAQDYFNFSMDIHNENRTDRIKVSLIPKNKYDPNYKGNFYEFFLNKIENNLLEDIKSLPSEKGVKANLTLCTDTAFTNTDINLKSDYLILTLCNLRIKIQ